MKRFLLRVFVACSFLLVENPATAQRYLAEYDTMMFFRDTLRPFLKRFENLHFSGYIQPQFQVAQSKGIDSYAGGDFREFADNRFIIRRARVKLDYVIPNMDNNSPKAIFTFQFEATERDVNVRDMFVRVFEPKKNFLSLSMGLFSRPFGYEVNLSSGFRETPERGRASQALMPSERDLGAMISYEPRKRKGKTPAVKFDIGMFNGQGKSGPAEFDSFKDLISRFTVRPSKISDHMELSGGLSLLLGGWVQATRYRYEMGTLGGKPVFMVDSSMSNIGKKAPRRYYGADLQWVLNHDWGKTELRGEYWQGTQPGEATTVFNPGTLPLTPTYIRSFDAAFFYFLQNLGSTRWELMAKYDWFDPNRRASGLELDPAQGLDEGDVRFDTFGFGLTRYFRDNLKFLAYYDIVRNEKTLLPGYQSDRKDNVFTFRVQLRF